MASRKDERYKLTAADLMRILQDRKDGVCLSDIESALIGRIVVLRAKGKPINAETLLAVLRDVRFFSNPGTTELLHRSRML